ncbi:ZIP family metal transporter [Halobacillus halophilus]|uniref:ZIP family metal transporter n=1 Tax=Halobacillus halophilus TaxID=1570 RepID=UPI001CD4849E|nr:hypothetical protein [Halobacillus halophilus]MCA1011499.1 hypothetical protein [Halobacillus halophilus]
MPIWLISAVACGTGIGLGGLFAWFLKGCKVSFVFAYSTGLILGMAALEMIPDSLQLGGGLIFILGVTAGVLLFWYIHHLIDHITIITRSPKQDLFMRTVILLTAGMFVHNFPMGVVLGTDMDQELWTVMLVTLIVHNIPEGIIIFTPLFLAGYGIGALMLFTGVIVFPIALGSLIGGVFHITIPYVLAFILNITIAIMVMIAVCEIFVHALKESSLSICILSGAVGFGSVYFLFVLQ